MSFIHEESFGEGGKGVLGICIIPNIRDGNDASWHRLLRYCITYLVVLSGVAGYGNVSEIIIALHFFNSEISFGITS